MIVGRFPLPLALLCVVFAGLLTAPPASAHGNGSIALSRAVATGPTPFTGRAWSPGVVRLYDTTPVSYREGVNIALRAWNASRVGVRFVRTSRRSAAHVVIARAPLLGFQTGEATIGRTRGAYVLLDTALVAVDANGLNTALGAIPEVVAEVTAHELGHVLGLGHTSGCSLMVTGNAPRCGLAAPPDGSWTCRLIHRRDIVALTRRYRGPGAVRANPYCPRSSTRAGRVGVISTPPATRKYPFELAWRRTTNTKEYVLARSAMGGSCPQSPTDSAVHWTLYGERPKYREYWDEEMPPRRGRYCFSIWSKNFRGQYTGPTRKVLEVVPPPVAPVTNVRASLSDGPYGYSVDLNWTNPSGTTAVRIYRVPGPTAECVAPETYPTVVASQGANSAYDYSVAAGTWTYIATRSDDPADLINLQEPGWASPPTCVTITVPARE